MPCISVEGVPYHITQRGDGRRQVFFDAADYQLCLDLLQRNATDAGLVIWGGRTEQLILELGA